MLFDHSTLVTLERYAKPNSEKLAQVRNKLQSSHYRIESFRCPICDNLERYTKVAATTEGFLWSICNDCGLLQINNRLTHQSLNEFYASGEYQDICMGGLDDDRHFNLEYKAMALHFFALFEKIDFALPGKSILEIGCGSGGILKAFKEKGAIVKGYDLDEDRVKAGLRYMSELESGDAIGFDKDLSGYDLILLSNVLEHLFDPRGFLLNLHDKIIHYGEPSIIVIDVPNLEGAHQYGNCFQDFLNIGHLWYFTTISLERLLNSTGFKVEEVFNRGAAMTLVCCAITEPIPNNNNSFQLSIGAINYANYKNDSNNSNLRAEKVINSVCASNDGLLRRLARRGLRAVNLMRRH